MIHAKIHDDSGEATLVDAATLLSPFFRGVPSRLIPGAVLSILGRAQALNEVRHCGELGVPFLTMQFESG